MPVPAIARSGTLSSSPRAAPKWLPETIGHLANLMWSCIFIQLHPALEFRMTTSPRLLLDTSIAQLQTLASFLAEEMGEYRQRTVVASPEARACKEILLTISVLIPKLQAARYVVADEAVRLGRCVDCEEG
jgi:hypothetical protein